LPGFSRDERLRARLRQCTAGGAFTPALES
jgi:hypothetical protein